MKDVLFLVPLYYTANAVERLQRYLREERPERSYDVVFGCSNPAIVEAAKEKAEAFGFWCEERTNEGIGPGALWWLRNGGVDIALGTYRYLWYLEESCEPVRPGWFERLLSQMDAGAPLSGWWWSSHGRIREHQVPHVYAGADGSRMVAYENTRATGLDPQGVSYAKLYDTPGYRNETFLVRTEDFLDFEMPDPRDPFWDERNGVRSYGVKAERFWWRREDVEVHGIPLPSPNLQWHVLQKHSFVPPSANDNRAYFRELPRELLESERYRPPPILVRRLRSVAAPKLERWSGRLGKRVRWLSPT